MKQYHWAYGLDMLFYFPLKNSQEQINWLQEFVVAFRTQNKIFPWQLFWNLKFMFTKFNCIVSPLLYI